MSIKVIPESISCGICLENIFCNIGYIPNCGHIFHMSCGSKWIESNRTCPICRTKCITMSKLCPTPPRENDSPNNQKNVMNCLMEQIGHLSLHSQHIEAETYQIKGTIVRIEKGYKKLTRNYLALVNDQQILKEKKKYLDGTNNKIKDDMLFIKASIELNSELNPELEKERNDHFYFLERMEDKYSSSKNRYNESSNPTHSQKKTLSEQINYPKNDIRYVEKNIAKLLISLKKEREKSIKIRCQIERANRDSFLCSISRDSNSSFNESNGGQNEISGITSSSSGSMPPLNNSLDHNRLNTEEPQTTISSENPDPRIFPRSHQNNENF